MNRAVTFAKPAVLAISLIAGSAFTDAQAQDIKFPKDKPRVAFEVPDGWSVTETPLGLELRAPEKNSFIVANLVKRSRGGVEAWTKQATEAMIKEGIAFDKDAKGPPANPATASSEKPATDKPATPAPLADVPVNPFTLSGDPAPEMNTTPPSINQPQDGPVVTMPDSVAGVAKADRPRIPFKVVQYYGASVAGKPVDVQLVLFNLDRDELFLMEQESTSEDGRAVAIVSSVKAVP